MTYAFADDASGITFLGVDNFREWRGLLADDAARDRANQVLVAAYGVGIVGGLLWGGLRGLLAGWAAAAALKYGMGTVVYMQQPDKAYRNVAVMTSVVAAADVLIAKWFADSVD